MALFRLLMRRYPDAVRAGELSQALSIKPSTLSMHLAALAQDGLIAQTREGTARLYRIQMDRVQWLMDYLFADCCRGRVDLCPIRPDAAPPRKFNVLFICTGNSARSIFAEAILRAEAGDRFIVHSAGTRQNSQLNPLAVEMLKAKGHDITPLRAKNVDEFRGPGAPEMDFVFTVCDQAANEECPAWEGQPVTAHWGVPDPVKATGSLAERRLAFQQAYGLLRNRIRAFAALPLETQDRIARQTAVDRIATMEGLQ